MSVKYIDSSGNITTVAGLTPAGGGGGGMPTLNYTTPLATLDGTTSYTATKECYLVGNVGRFVSGTQTQSWGYAYVNNNEIVKIYCGAGTYYVTLFIPPLKLSAGDIVSFNGASQVNTCLQVLEEVT